MVWTFYDSPFPPVPVRFVYCNVCFLVYRMRLSTHSRAMFLRKKMLSQQNRQALTRTFPRGALYHECITVLNASKYCTGLLLDNPTGPQFCSQFSFLFILGSLRYLLSSLLHPFSSSGLLVSSSSLGIPSGSQVKFCLHFLAHLHMILSNSLDMFSKFYKKYLGSLMFLPSSNFKPFNRWKSRKCSFNF